METQGNIRIGISGWRYTPWRGTFYPKNLRQKDELSYAASILRSIEINGTFYGTQKPHSFEVWHDTTPENFQFSIKAPRFITHTKRLRDIEAPLANFFASGIFRLNQKLGPILWQFPPSIKFDRELFMSFFKMLPHNTISAAKLAQHHDTKLRDVDDQKPHRYRLRHAVEIRHESFRNPAFIELLRENDIALVCADAVKWPTLMNATSDFIYCRLHGNKELYASGYDDKELAAWAERVRAWAKGNTQRRAELVPDTPRDKTMPRDVFVYFDNDIKIRAPVDAEKLQKILRLS